MIDIFEIAKNAKTITAPNINGKAGIVLTDTLQWDRIKLKNTMWNSRRMPATTNKRYSFLFIKTPY